MQPKSTLPTAEVTVLPVRARIADQGDAGSRPCRPNRSSRRRRRRTRDISGRPRPACHAGAPERRHFAGGVVAGLYGLAVASGFVAAAADRNRAGSLGRRQALLRRLAALLLARAGAVVADQAAAAGQALRPAGVGTSAVQSDGAGLSARRTMVAQCDHGRARRGEAERGDRRVLGPADAGRDVALQFCRDQSGGGARASRRRKRLPASRN